MYFGEEYMGPVMRSDDDAIPSSRYDRNYLAEDGWFYRPSFNLPLVAWFFYRFQLIGDGPGGGNALPGEEYLAIESHLFCTDGTLDTRITVPLWDTSAFGHSEAMGHTSLTCAPEREAPERPSVSLREALFTLACRAHVI